MRGTIKNSSDIENLFETGEKLKTKGIILIIGNTPEGRGHKGRAAFIAGKKLGNAPKRNKAKRIMRNVYRDLGEQIPGKDIVFLAKSRIFDLEYKQLVSDCKTVSFEIMNDTEGK